MPPPERGLHGMRLTDEEFERRVRLLVAALPPLPDAAQDEAFRRQELDLLVEHRLGADFPAARRQALWVAHQRVNRRRARLVLARLLPAVLSPRLATVAQRLVDYAAREYGQVLSPPELRAFLGGSQGDRPALPIDFERIS